jgi:hypothetical protein
MAFSETKCAVKLAAAAKGIIGQDDLKKVFDAVDNRQGNETLETSARKSAEGFSSQKEYEAFLSKLSKITDLQARRGMAAMYQNLSGKERPKGTAYEMAQKIFGIGDKKLSPAQILESFIMGRTDVGLGTAHGAAPIRDAIGARETERLDGLIKKNKLDAYARGSGRRFYQDAHAYDAPVKEAMQNLYRKKAGLTAVDTPVLDKLPPEIRSDIEKLAGLYKESLDRGRARLAVRNIFVENPDYMGPTTHDRAKISHAAGGRPFSTLATHADAEAYGRFTVPLLDFDRTADNLIKLGRMTEDEKPKFVANPKLFVDTLFNVFSTGVRLTDSSVGRGGNIIAKAQKAHILEFKDARSSAEYQRRFGHGNMLEAVQQQLRNNAHFEATAQFFGANPERNLEAFHNDLSVGLRRQMDAARGKDSALFNRLQKQEAELQKTSAFKDMGTYLGNTDRDDSQTATKITNGILAVNQLRFLGSAFFANLTQIATGHFANRCAGVEMFRSMFAPLTIALRRMLNHELDEWLQQAGSSKEGQLLQSALDLTGGQSLQPGKITQTLVSLFHNLTLLAPSQRAVRYGYVAEVANKLARSADIEFSKLEPGVRNNLVDYGISPQEWDVLRSHAVGDMNGYKVLNSDGVAAAPDDAFKFAGESKNAVARARNDLEMKLVNLYRSGADYASVSHNLKTTALVKRYLGDSNAMRLTTQFMTFPLAHGQLVLQRAFKAQSFPQFVALTLGGLTITGIFGMWLRNLAQGKNLMADDDLWSDDKGKSAQAWGRLVAGGAANAGVGGIMSDLLFSQTYSNGQGSSLQTLLGPTGDTLSQLGRYAYAGLEGKKIEPDSALRWAQGQAPGVNIWWIKPMINYLWLYGLEEQLNPGSLHRLQTKAKENGAPFWLSPDTFVPNAKR